jgi:phospholipid/cholesterol/gamma-HCH transport system ATP-binding protein
LSRIVAAVPHVPAEQDQPPDTSGASKEVVIRVRDLKVAFGPKVIMEGLDLDVFRGEILGFVGASGTGKSVLTRAILGLVAKQQGLIEVLGQNLDELDNEGKRQFERRFGVMFQQGALFSALTVKENIQVPMREYLHLSPGLLNEMAMLKIELVGLKPDAADKMPSELSGGMIKRAALARALSLDPEIVFLDEPTSGLDPIGAAEFDDLIQTLQRTLGLTVFMVTHDLDSLYSACDRIAALADRKVIAAGPLATMLASNHPWVKAYFGGERAMARSPGRHAAV